MTLWRQAPITASLADRGDVRALLGGVHPLESIRDAQEAFQRQEHVGSLVIRIT